MAGIPIQHSGDELARPVALNPAEQAFWVLRVGYTALPMIAGLDKFTHVLANWDLYLAPAVARMLPVAPHTFMLVVGVIEMVAGLVVALAPRIGGWIVAAWLAGIIVNLLMTGGFYDIALRDFGLLLGAVALARLAETHQSCTMAKMSGT